MSSPAGDERLLAAVCEIAAREPGDIETAVRRHVERLAPLARPDHAAALVHAALARLEGLGRLDALLRDPRVDEVLVNPGGDVWIEHAGRVEQRGHIDDAELAVVIERILAPLGRRLDRSSPIVDARLADGTRVCAVVPPIAIGGTTLSLRRFRSEPFDLDAFCDEPTADVLRDLVEHRCNLVVSGATSSGKTSLLSSLLALAGHEQRLVILEDTAELTPPRANVVRLEARPATADGVAAVTLAQLVRTALRLRPDRIVVGEVRGDEVLDLLQALNTGHDGSLATVHANSALDALHRLETLIVQAAPAWPLRAVRQQLGRSIDAVVHTARGVGGRRQVVEIAEVGEPPADSEAMPTVRPLVSDGRAVARRTRGRR